MSTGEVSWECDNYRHEKCTAKDCSCYCHGGDRVAADTKFPVPVLTGAADDER